MSDRIHNLCAGYVKEWFTLLVFVGTEEGVGRCVVCDEVAYPVEACFYRAVAIGGSCMMNQRLSSFPIFLVINSETDDGWGGGAVACFLPCEHAAAVEEGDVAEAELLRACCAGSMWDGVFSYPE